MSSAVAGDARRHASLRRSRTKKYFFATAFGTLILAGCATYEAKPLDPALSAQQFAARTLDAPQWQVAVAHVLPQTASNWPPSEWNRASLFALALAANPQLAVARSQVQIALAHEELVGLPTNPGFTVQSEYARHDPHPWLYGVAFDFLLRWPAQKRAELDLARLGSGKAQWQLLEEVWGVRRSVIAALSDAEAARRRTGVLERLAAAQARAVAIGEQRVNAGEDAPGALLILRQAQLEIAEQQADAHAAANAAQSALATALGMPPAALDGIVWRWLEWGDPPSQAESPGLRDAREQALLTRADLASAIVAYAESENKLHQAVLRQYPQLQLQPGYYWDHGIAKFPFDVGFTLPLFNHGEISEARAARETAGQQMLALQAQIYGAIATAERAENGARDSVASAEHTGSAVREQRRQAQTGFRLGALGSEDSAAADVLVLRSELETLQLRAQLQAARNALEDALHTPLSGPELEIARDFTVLAGRPDR